MLKLGDRGELVSQLQRALNSALVGHPRLPVTGAFMDLTRAGVELFQKSKHLPPTGVVDDKTWSALGQTSPLRSAEDDEEPDWMRIARQELGVKEVKSEKRHNTRIVEYLNTCTNISQHYRDRDETAWCSAFVNWVLNKSGYNGTNHALADSWLQWGHRIDTPRVGAVVVIKKSGASSDATTGSTTGNHVGFFLSKKNGWIRLLGGNQKDSVCEMGFGLGVYLVRGIRWPEPETSSGYDTHLPLKA